MGRNERNRMQTEQNTDKKISDPVREYLNALKWDGVERVSKWAATYLGDDTAEANAAGQRWLIQAVARACEPGCQADGVLVLQGGQGVGKTTALKTLGGCWFTDSIGDPKNKDTYLNLLGKWIIELAEIDSMKRSERESFKAFVTSRDDYFREPYAKHLTSHPRRCVFAATTNSDIPETTGSRRFWLVQVEEVCVAALQRDRDQLWAEAVHMFKNKTPWWVDSVQPDEDNTVDTWQTFIANHLKENASTSTTVSKLLDALKIEQDKWTRADQMRVAVCLKNLGWVKERFEGTFRYVPHVGMVAPS
jgi:putative DNA primase/helicase